MGRSSQEKVFGCGTTIDLSSSSFYIMLIKLYKFDKLFECYHFDLDNKSCSWIAPCHKNNTSNPYYVHSDWSIGVVCYVVGTLTLYTVPFEKCTESLSDAAVLYLR